jgi:hypothetical protein
METPKGMTESEYRMRLMEARRIEDAANVGGLVSKLVGIYVQLEVPYEQD